MTITSTTAAAAGQASAAERSRTSLASDFGGFLQLLTTQLQNQDPLAPMDADKFTSQLVQFSSVEQAIATNRNLERMSGLLDASMRSSALGYLGSEVELNGAVVQLEGGGAAVRYSLAREATDVQIRFFDAAGNPVATQVGRLAEGANEVLWNGVLADGRRAPPGAYRVEVTAKDAAGAPVPVRFSGSGTVTRVDLSGEVPALVVNGALVPFTNVRAVGTPAA
jgi:flagellar basal-body rod modification protein FlgD